MESMDQQYLNNICRLCCGESKSMLPLEKVLTLEHQDGTRVKLDLNYLIHVCVDMNVLDIDCDFPNNPKVVCISCVNQLKSFYSFKQSCRSNNDNFFMCEKLEVLEESPETACESKLEISNVSNPSNVKAEESSGMTSYIYEEMEPGVDAYSIETIISTDSSYNRHSKKHAENSKNALRQKIKRELETPEEKAERRKRVAEATRLRRERMRIENPDKYAEVLKRVADRKRERRKLLDVTEKQILREKESIAARQRRAQLDEEKKELYKVKNRELARQKRVLQRLKYEPNVTTLSDETCSTSQMYLIAEEV